MIRRNWKLLVAVIGGNVIYFYVLFPFLPPAAQHQRNQIDLGLFIDFWICLALYGLLTFRFGRPRSGKHNQKRD